MTLVRQRMFGSDIEFLAWCRKQEKELPSREGDCRIALTDVDVIFHNFMTAVDSQGSRELQALIQLEIKSRNGDLTDAQRDTYCKQHICSSRRKTINGQVVNHFGVAFVFLSDTQVDNSGRILWGRFDPANPASQKIIRTEITKEQFFQLARCEIHPDTLKPRWARRHHLTRQIIQVVTAPLGFTMERIVTKRS